MLVHIIAWKRCLNCKVRNTVRRGRIAEQSRTGGQFLCMKCGEAHLEDHCLVHQKGNRPFRVLWYFTSTAGVLSDPPTISFLRGLLGWNRFPV